VLPIALGVALFAAVASSLALALRRRATASYFVAACWIVLTIGSAFYLSSIEKGPQQFDRYAGELHFRIPWKYGPSGSDKPTPNGISFFLCLDSLAGRYDASCTHNKQNQVSIYPPKLVFMGGVDESNWERFPDRWKPLPDRDGHKAYIKSIAAEANRKEITSYYFRLTDANDKLLRTVSCFENGDCSHYAWKDRYILFYTAPKSAFPEWEAMDRSLGSLVDSWAVP
jgi:hypothetical protein